MQAIIPIDPADPEGATVTLDESHFEVLGDRGDVVVIRFHTLTESIDWFDEFEVTVLQTSARVGHHQGC